jgi:two-component system cell cycle sensor histidine kinase/response regulator CckA
MAYRVLIVDDEKAILGFVDRVLRKAGYQTTFTLGAAEALELLPVEPPFDLLLTDLVMPTMNGDELARRFCQHLSDLKVLYFTGFSDRLFAERHTLRSNEAFLDKPVTATGLLEAVSLLLFGHTRGLPTNTRDAALDPAFRYLDP